MVGMHSSASTYRCIRLPTFLKGTVIKGAVLVSIAEHICSGAGLVEDQTSTVRLDSFPVRAVGPPCEFRKLRLTTSVDPLGCIIANISTGQE